MTSITNSVPDTTLGLTNDEIQLLRRHQVTAASMAGATELRAASSASSQGLLLLDSSSLATLLRHFDKLMRHISERLDYLSQQSEIVLPKQSDRGGNSLASVETQIVHFNGIIKQIDELEDEFDRMRRIKDIVRRFRLRVEEMESNLSEVPASPTGVRSRRRRSSRERRNAKPEDRYDETDPTVSYNQISAFTVPINVEPPDIPVVSKQSSSRNGQKVIDGWQQEDLPTSLYDLTTQDDTVPEFLSTNDSHLDINLDEGMTLFSRDSGYASMASKGFKDVREQGDEGQPSSALDSYSIASLEGPFTENTFSSVNPAALGGAAEEFAETLMQDKMINSLILKGYESMDANEFERKFRRILKQYASDLRNEAKNELEKGAVRIVHSYRAYVTRIIRKRISQVEDEHASALDELQKQKTSKLVLERFLEQLRMTDTYAAAASAEDCHLDSDNGSEFSDDGKTYLPNLEKVKEFLMSSAAFTQLGQRLCDVVGAFDIPQQTSTKTHSMTRAKTSNHQRKVGRYLLLTIQNEWARAWRPKPAEGYSRIEWTCNCGHDLYADFKESSQNKLDKIAAILQCTPNPRRHPSSGTAPRSSLNNITSPPMVYVTSNSSINISKHSLSSSQEYDTSLSTSYQETSADIVDDLPTPSFLELCVNTGEHLKTLGEINLTNINCDGDLFKIVKEHYLRLRSFRTKFWLLKPAAVSYVRFSLENRHRVGILQKPLALPPKSEVDAKKWIYDPCPLDGDPPIAEDLFLHYLQCTERSSTLFWMLRLPRKLQESILTTTTAATVFGWGIHIDEGLNFAAIFWANFTVLALSGVAALLWNLFEHDFQGAFGFACWIVTVLNSLLMAYLFKWKQT